MSEGRVLVEVAVDGRVAVDPNGAGIDDATDVLVPCRFKNHLRSVDVDGACTHRVGKDVIDVGNCSEMNDCVHVARRAEHGLRMSQVTDNGGDPWMVC